VRGARRDRGTHFFKTHGARVGPEGEDDQSARWERLALLLDDETDYSPADLDRALEPVDPEDPWGEPATESGRDYTDETTGADTDTETTEGDGHSPHDDDDSDRSGSLSDFSE